MHIPFNTALVTGSSRGIGRAIARKLATEGVKKIAVHYRTRKGEAETTVSQLEMLAPPGFSCKATYPTQPWRRTS